MADKKPDGKGWRTRAGAAVNELEKIAREILEVEQHVAPEARVEAIELPLALGFHGADSRIGNEFRAAEADKLIELLRGRVRDALLNAVAFQRGRVYCLRCENSLCSHSAPPTARSVFSGYEETGRPEWIELDQLLGRRNDPRIERLYSDRRREVVALALHRNEIYGRLLPGFEAPRFRCYVLGQLCVGWFVPNEPDGAPPRDPRGEPMALTIQLLRTEKQPDGPLLGLNLIGRRPDGAPLARNENGSPAPNEENILDGLPDAMRQLRREISVFSGRGGSRAPGVGVALERLANRCWQLLRDASRDLEHRRRIDGKRTGHARDRARQGDRPTTKAFEDARAAADEQLFFDVARETICVVGPKSRVHFFTPAGRHVTSVVFAGHVVSHRIGQKRWAPLDPEKRATFRRLLEPMAAPPATR